MIELQKTSYLDHTIRTEPLHGDAFTDEQGGHKFIITCYQHGEKVNLTGTISGRFMRPGGTVALTGSVSDGNAIITLSSECYERNGGFLLTVFNTVGNDKFVIYACTGNVRRSKSDPLIDGGEIIDSVEDLIADIQTATAQIPVNYNASFAPAYSTTGTYAVGAYVTNNGNLYRCTTAITSGETWNSAHWTQVALGDDVADLKSAVADLDAQIINVFNPAKVTEGKKLTYSAGYSINTLQNQSNSALSEIIPCKAGDVITIRGGQAGSSAGISNNYGIVFAGDDGIILSAVNQPDRNTNNPYTATAPEGATCFRFNVNTNYESDLTKKYCTINRGTLPYDVPYGVLAVPQAGDGLLGGISAEAKTNDDTQEVKIDPATGKLFVNVNPATSDNRRFYAPAIYYGNNVSQILPWRSIYWARQMDSVYYRSPNKTTAATNKVMPKYFVMTAPSGFNQARATGAMNIHAFDAKTDNFLESVQIATRFINPQYLTNPSGTKNLLVIGDSFVNGKVIPDRIRDMLDDYGLTNIAMVGEKQTDNGVKYTAYGGHGYYDFTTNPSSLPSGHVNPFWHNGAVDFEWYASELGVTSIDYFIIHLGVNDMLDGTSAEQVATYMESFVGSIHSAFPNAVVVVDGMVIPSMDCPSNYNPVDQALKVHQYNAVIEAAANEITNTYFAPVVALFNAEYAYPYTTQAPVEGSTESVKVLTDYLHPYTPGYYQIADEALWCLLYNASGI